jgi:cytidylate kinase
MSSVLVSSNVQNIAENTAKKLAQQLGYTYIGISFLETVANEFNTSVDKLQNSLNRLKSPKTVSNKSIDLNLAYIQQAVLEKLLNDNTVCEGLAAHFYVRDVSHILNVRVISESKENKYTHANNKNNNFIKFLRIIDPFNILRTNGSNQLSGIDENDESIYDIVLNTGKIGIDNAINTIVLMAKDRKFKPMNYSRKMLIDLTLASKFRVLLLSRFSGFKVVADRDTVIVHIKCSKRQKVKIAEEIKDMANRIPEIKIVEVHSVAKLPQSNERIEKKG